MCREIGFCHGRLSSPHRQICSHCCSACPDKQSRKLKLFSTVSLLISTSRHHMCKRCTILGLLFFCFDVHFPTDWAVLEQLPHVSDSGSFLHHCFARYLFGKEIQSHGVPIEIQSLVSYFLLCKIKESSFTLPFKANRLHYSTVMVLPSVTPSRCQPFSKHSMHVRT